MMTTATGFDLTFVDYHPFEIKNVINHQYIISIDYSINSSG